MIMMQLDDLENIGMKAGAITDFYRKNAEEIMV